MSDCGWIKLYRSILNNPFMRSVDVLGTWVYILLNVAYQPEDVVFKGKRITLQPGQGLFKIRQMAKEIGVSHSKLNRTISLFKSETQIETQTSSRETLISVVNWGKYQMSETQNETQMEHWRNTGGTQAEHLPIIKELKNIKNIRNNNNIVDLFDESENENKQKPPDKFEVFWKEYPKKKGIGAARKAFEKAIKKATLETLIEAVRKQKQGDQWKKDKGKFIPYPATWLNQERWEDEVDDNGDGTGYPEDPGLQRLADWEQQHTI